MDEQRRWLDSEVEKVVNRKRKMAELEDELKKREEILAKKEELLRQKGQIEIKKLRSSQVVSKVCEMFYRNDVKKTTFYFRSFLAKSSGKTFFFPLTVSSIDNRLYQSCADVLADIDPLL